MPVYLRAALMALGLVAVLLARAPHGVTVAGPGWAELPSTACSLGACVIAVSAEVGESWSDGSIRVEGTATSHAASVLRDPATRQGVPAIPRARAARLDRPPKTA